MSGDIQNGKSGFQVKVYEQLLDTSPPEPIICETFGCRHILTRAEYLSGKYCTQCGHERRQKELKNIFQ